MYSVDFMHFSINKISYTSSIFILKDFVYLKLSFNTIWLFTFVTMNLVERIQKIIDDSELSSAAFADRIGVQRSSISHVLSGRNKPSLDFVLKILHAFPTVQSSWLLTGNNFSSSEAIATDEPTLFPNEAPKNPIPTSNYPHTTPKESVDSIENTPDAKRVERVTVFYSDGTCETYTNKK